MKPALIAILVLAAGCSGHRAPIVPGEIWTRGSVYELIPLPGHEQAVDYHTLPRRLRRDLQRLHVGSTRRAVYRAFQPDGGLNQHHCERSHAIAPLFQAGIKKWVMVFIAYKPHGMPESTYTNLEARLAWYEQQKPGSDERDVVAGFSHAFIADGLTVD